MVKQFKISDDLVKQKLIYSCTKLYLKRLNSSGFFIWMTTNDLLQKVGKVIQPPFAEWRLHVDEFEYYLS